MNTIDKIALISIVVFIVLFFKPVVSGDGFGYYVITQGLWRDHTLNLEKQTSFNEALNATIIYKSASTGRWVSKYPPGIALVAYPLYLPALFLSQYIHFKDDFFMQMRGDTLLPMLSIVLTGLIFLVIAIYYSLKMCDKLGLSKHKYVAVALAFFGTSMLRYGGYDLTYTHVFEAGLFAAMVYYTLFEEKPLLTGVFYGMLSLMRYSNLLFASPLLFYFIFYKTWPETKRFILGAAPFILILALYNLVAYGSPFASGYENYVYSVGGGATPYSLIPIQGAWNVLFGLGRDPAGLILWTPLIFLAVIGFWALDLSLEKKLLATSLGLSILYVASAFYYGQNSFSFGNRFFVPLFSLVVVGTANFMKIKPKLNWIPVYFAGLTLIFFLMQFSVDWTQVLPPEPVMNNHIPVINQPSFVEMVSYWIHHWQEFPEAVFNKLGIVRLVMEK